MMFLHASPWTCRTVLLDNASALWANGAFSKSGEVRIAALENTPSFPIFFAPPGNVIQVAGENRPLKRSATVALLAALVRRARVKHGGYFVTSQLGSSVYGGITRFADVLAGRTPLGPLGAASADIVPDDAFRAVDGYIIVSALTERCWQRLCEGLEQPELCKNSRFATNAVRVDNRTELTQLLAEIFAQETTATWCERLTAADVPCAPAPKPMRLLDALNSHPQIRECQLVARIPSAYGLLASHAPHWSFERTPASIASGSPLLGEHTELVLANMTDKQGLIAALEADRHKSSVPAMEPA